MTHKTPELTKYTDAMPIIPLLGPHQKVDFQILDRRPFDAEKFKKEKVISYTGPSIPPEPQERGWKDTVRANPEQVTRIIMKFGPYTGFVCLALSYIRA
ncbi:hypothetical protein QFZ72_001248 [Bacillus sp. V2I10]|nr:hypothetical protein [Bacillus sp. V2I10]MDQ0857769.1 hypothetical protein [Bacillus sp. V2I10]